MTQKKNHRDVHVTMPVDLVERIDTFIKKSHGEDGAPLDRSAWISTSCKAMMNLGDMVMEMEAKGEKPSAYYLGDADIVSSLYAGGEAGAVSAGQRAPFAGSDIPVSLSLKVPEDSIKGLEAQGIVVHGPVDNRIIILTAGHRQMTKEEFDREMLAARERGRQEYEAELVARMAQPEQHRHDPRPWYSQFWDFLRAK